MPTITIAIAERPMSRLKELADKAGVTPEEMLSESAERWLTDANTDFAEAARYVLNKNEELYRRLA